MTSIRFVTDEDVYSAVVVQLRAAGFEAISTPEAGRMGEPDESQLRWAATDGRAIVTFNVADFARLHHEWMLKGDHHAGVIVSQQRPVGDVIRRLLNLSAALSADDMFDR
ncbi:MAG TPA: DUF5615 family PIN-like protein, partial [Planctomycetaceae bacterium]|nr:DUF5615 family PIN-like protein [Planctomycetaceae bacterium]